ncbi:DUF4376 domain-containing protein [Stutzerimonas stutzeri]|nr:DUF4376 domain-containing protein [Stutzerimonas stutzeri]
MFVKVNTRSVISAEDIRLSHPEISFPPSIAIDHISHLGYAVLEEDPQPEVATGETVQPGEIREDEGRYIRGWVVVTAPAPSATDVDAERDRRISAGFEFDGVRYQSRLPSPERAGDWEVFSGKALEALMAIMGGAQPGDLRWSDPAEDFAWIAADNSRVPMDAQTVIELAKAASAHRTKHTFAGSDLKQMDPIPADYTDDKYWP